MIRYEKLFNRLSSQQMSQYFLTTEKKVSPSQINRLRHNRGVNTSTLNTLCEILHCGLDDIAEYSENTEDTFVDQRHPSRRKAAGSNAHHTNAASGDTGSCHSDKKNIK